MALILKIANLVLSIAPELEIAFMYSRYSSFVVQSDSIDASQFNIIRFSVERESYISQIIRYKDSHDALSIGSNFSLSMKNGGTLIWQHENAINSTVDNTMVFFVNSSYTEVLVYLPEDIHYEIPVRILDTAIQNIFQLCLIAHDGFVLHASAISYQGSSILFYAPSGTGKSTQSKLWIRLREAQIVNNDRPIVRLIGDKPVVFGSPWSGSEQSYFNVQYPLNALVFIQQYHENIANYMSKFDFLGSVLKNTLVPEWDCVLYEHLVKSLLHVYNIAKCMSLKCNLSDSSLYELERVITNEV